MDTSRFVAAAYFCPTSSGGELGHTAGLASRERSAHLPPQRSFATALVWQSRLRLSGRTLRQSDRSARPWQSAWPSVATKKDESRLNGHGPRREDPTCVAKQALRRRVAALSDRKHRVNRHDPPIGA